MKTILKNTKKLSLYFGFLFIAIGLFGCSDDDDAIPDEPNEPLAEITAEDQVITQNILIVEEVMVDRPSWLLVKKVNDDNSFTNPIAEPLLLSEGTESDITVELNSDEVTLEDGARLILQLYVDDGDGVFDAETDDPITDEFGGIVSEEIMVSSPSFTITNMAVVDSTLTFDNVYTPLGGFIVIHGATAEGTIDESNVVGTTYVEAGELTDVAVTFDEDFVYEPGDTVYARLYMDNPADQTFTFMDDPATDMPFTFGFEDDASITNEIILE
ncbi:MAG TPA: hypothetical protein VFI78_00275 [Salinimicrobium sp.]|nr:hypothetical protein [Salinimicrobium sp.]